MCSDRGLCAKDAAALLSSPREDFSAVPIGHAYPKSHFVFSLTIMRLKCTFHEGLLSKNVPAKSQRMIVYSRRGCQVFYQQPLYKPTGRREFRFPTLRHFVIVAIQSCGLGRASNDQGRTNIPTVSSCLRPVLLPKYGETQLHTWSLSSRLWVSIG